MDKGFFRDNRQKIAGKIKDNSVLILFAGQAPHKSADENYAFTPNRNFYYLTGLVRENFIFMLTKIKGKIEEMLFIEKADPVLEKWVGKRLTDNEARELSGIENIQYLEDFEGRFNGFLFRHNPEYVYLDLERRGWSNLKTREESFAQVVIEKYPFALIQNIYQMICNERRFKTQEEVEVIKQAIAVTDEGIRNMMTNVKPGMMEYEIEAFFDFTLLSKGIRAHAFPTIAASGVNGTILHYSQNNCCTGDEDLILFDLGAQYEYYNADITRTFPVNGKFTERQKEIYNIVLKAQLETIKAIKPGVHYRELNNTTKRVLAEECIRIGLIKEESELSRYYYHGVSHYLGLDTHDVGNTDTELMPGMILTVEPGLYIEEENIGIRIEDDVLVTEDGCENLSKDIIKTIDEIEEFMNK